MTADHPFRWIGGAALVVGMLVLGATSFQKQPRALALSLERTTVAYANTKSEAVAKASQPVAAVKVASRDARPPKQAERIASLPIAPASCMTLTAWASAAGMSAPAPAGQQLSRVLKAIASEPMPAAVPTRDVRTIHGNQVASSSQSEVLLATRPLRGPPSV